MSAGSVDAFIDALSAILARQIMEDIAAGKIFTDQCAETARNNQGDLEDETDV